jgi:hypothetical protein
MHIDWIRHDAGKSHFWRYGCRLIFRRRHQMGVIGVQGVTTSDLAIARPMHGVHDRHRNRTSHRDYRESAVVVYDIEKPTNRGASVEHRKYPSGVVGLKCCRTEVPYAVGLFDLVHSCSGRRAGWGEKADPMPALDQPATQQADGTFNTAGLRGHRCPGRSQYGDV